MTDLNLPNNSNKAKREQQPARPKREKVVTSEVVKRKKPLGSKIKDTFTGDDAKTVGQFIVVDVIVPTVKDLIFEIVTQALGRSMWGNAARGGISRLQQGPQRQGNFVSYNVMSKPQMQQPQMRAMSPDGPMTQHVVPTAAHQFDQLLFTNRGEPELVLERLADAINEYRMAAVSELYELIGHPTTPSDNNWGWYSLAGAGVQQVNRGYVLNLPKPIELK